MNKQVELQGLFPKGKTVMTKQHSDAVIYFPLEEGWFEVAVLDLTERERKLLPLFLEATTKMPAHPWERYFQGTGGIPQRLEKLQVLQVRLWSVSNEEDRGAWVDMMTSLLPNLVAFYTSNDRDYCFVVEQSVLFDVHMVLSDVLSAMEFDFGLRMSIFIGQIWPKDVEKEWTTLIEAEQSLFAQWQNVTPLQSQLLSFSQLYLWTREVDSILGETLYQLLVHHQLEKEIIALWQEGAVLTKAAQRLYIHRNTLQYRLDKWYDWTGLQLKNLTDLAMCYIILMSHRPFEIFRN